MNSLEMVKDNVDTASSVQIGEMGAEEEAMLQQVVAAINSKMKVGCTGCGYCVPCPKHVDIPGTFAAYNRLHTEGKFSGWKEYFMCTAVRSTSTAASNCIGCGKCESHCPQHLPIRQELKNAQKELEVPLYKIARKFIQWFKLY
jgi:predicted aldo/keto reductase-like oxidoreductase